MFGQLGTRGYDKVSRKSMKKIITQTPFEFGDYHRPCALEWGSQSVDMWMEMVVFWWAFCFFWETPFLFVFKDMLPSVASWCGEGLSLVGVLVIWLFFTSYVTVWHVRGALLPHEVGTSFFDSWCNWHWFSDLLSCKRKEKKQKTKQKKLFRNGNLLSFSRLWSQYAHDTGVWKIFWTRSVKIPLLPSPIGCMLWSFGFSLLIWGICIDSFKTVGDFLRVSLKLQLYIYIYIRFHWFIYN